MPRLGHRLPDCQEQQDRKVATDTLWLREAINAIEADFHRSGETHLIHFRLKQYPGIGFYLKDESAHPSGSLKHRLARSLFLYGICNGRIGPETPIVECSSGSTAISEAYFARMLGLKFHAVVPRGTAPRKIEAIERLGATCHVVAPPTIEDHAVRLAAEIGGHFMDQFTFAERATDWRGNNNIAESLFRQMSLETCPIPNWVVVGAGTGGTSATFGRYIRYRKDLCEQVKVCVVDPDSSVLFDHFRGYLRADPRPGASMIEGIGRPTVPYSFIPEVIDRMIKVPDAHSIAAMHWISEIVGKPCGGSTGTNMIAALTLAAEMVEAGRSGAIATLICDAGDRYQETYYNSEWVASQHLAVPEFSNYLASLEPVTAIPCASIGASTTVL